MLLEDMPRDSLFVSFNSDYQDFEINDEWIIIISNISSNITNEEWFTVRVHPFSKI
jgi:hypothetical protein